MTAGCEHVEHRRLRAPRDSGTGMLEPSWDKVADVLEGNREQQAESCYDVQGKCLRALSSEARSELLDTARRWTAAYRDPGNVGRSGQDRLFLAGHQPQMFHPGVWLKNFVLGRLAESQSGIAVNLIIDSDTIRTRSIRVPGGTAENPNVADIPFDGIGPAVPFEERRVLDPQTFATFAERVQQQIRPLVPNAIVNDYWRLATNRLKETDCLGLCLAQSRHSLEGAWGNPTLELPQSAVCDSASFRWFACHLFDEAARFRLAHNEVLRQYRHAHRIRSQSHPAADLGETDGWQETPFWIWTPQVPRRRRLFVRRTGDELRLTNRRNLEITLPLPRNGDAARAVEALEGHSQQGVRIRSRALITTMWARLALSDLFVHGIGGAKYDQVTDALIARFFESPPPRYMIVSGTLHLPVAHQDCPPDAIRQLHRRLRWLEFQPERFLDEVERSGNGELVEARRLASEKWDWIDTPVTRENCRERFLAIRRLSERMQSWVQPLRDETLDTLASAERLAAANAILTWREYAFCLYPGEGLQEFFSRLLPKRA